MKKFLILFSITCLFSVTAYSQNNVAYKKALQKMLIASGSEKTYKVVINQMISTFKKQKTNVPAAFWNKMNDKFSATSMSTLIDMFVPVYQKHLSIEDLNGLTAFYESPVGKKFAQKSPLIMQESMQIGQQWGMKLGQEIAEELKKSGH